MLALQAIALILFGLNPLVWVLYARLTYLRELRCDEAAIGETGIDPVDYSRLLYAFVENQARRPRLTMTGTAFSENHHAILKRFQHILNLQEGAMKLRKGWHYLAPVLLGLAILPLSIQGVEQRSNPPDVRQSDDYIPRPDEFVPVEEQPVPVKQPRPIYPEIARQAGVEGVVYVQALIDREGKVRDVKVQKGPEMFQEAAKEAMRESTWKPATRQGKPVTVWVAYPIRFTLKGGPPPPGVQIQEGPGNRPNMIKLEEPGYPPNTFRSESGETITVEQLPRMIKPAPPSKEPPKWTQAQFREALRNSPERNRGNVSIPIRVLVGADGKTHRAEVVEGPEGFREAALEGVRGAVWEPAMAQGKPVGVWVRFPWGFYVMNYKNTIVKAESGDTVVVDRGVLPVQMLKPVYPVAALKDSLEGVVYLNALVGEDGRVKQAEVIRGEEVFRQAAIEAAKESTWLPATRGGKPVAVWVIYPIRFTLQGGPPPGARILEAGSGQPSKRGN